LAVAGALTAPDSLLRVLHARGRPEIVETHLLDLDEVANLVNHPANLRRVLVHGRGMELPQAEAARDDFLVVLEAGHALHERDRDRLAFGVGSFVRHVRMSYALAREVISSSSLPRSR